MTAADRDPLEDLALAQNKLPSPRAALLIKEQCTQGLRPVRTLSARQRLGITLGLALGAIMLMLATAKVKQLQQMAQEVGNLFYAVVGWALVLSFVLALGIGRPPGKRAALRLRLLVAVLVPAAFLAYLAFTATETGPFSEALAARSTLGCGMHSFVCSSLVALGVMLPWRRTDPFNPGLTGALLALGGGLAAVLAMGVVCPSREGWHLWLAHGLALIAVVIAGAWVGRRWLAP